MKFLFFIFIFLLLIGLVQGLSISPGQIGFDLIKGEQECKMITLSNGNFIDIRGSDKWTNVEENKGKLSQYDMSASDFDIEISYQDYIKNMKKEAVEICITGNVVGEYLGAIVYQVDSSGSTSTGLGTWLMVNVKEESVEEEQPYNPSVPIINNGGKNSDSSGGSGLIPQKNNTEIINDDGKIMGFVEDSSNEENVETGRGITGAVIGGIGRGEIIGIVFVVIIIIGLIIYNKRKKRI